jgi:hypothetical protein
MEVLEVKSGLRKPVVVRAVEEKDFKKLTKRRYSFRWKALKGVAGCLIAFACNRAAEKYDGDACVSLVPKTNLVKHYMHKYHMVPKGRQLCLEDEALYYIIKKHLHV